ncbi:MAG TPA: metallophosphoesterase [Egibacteraceae bacterium]|nr:metallophosphoesterase [Egibacteraceae bacterium]
MTVWAEALTGLAAAGGLALGWASLVERRWFACRHHEVPALRGPGTLRILHVSDLHLLPWQRDKLAFVERLAAQRPDLVVATGDLLGHPGAIEPCVAALRSLRGDTPGIFVLGSNDFFAPGPRNPLAYFRGPSRLKGGQRRLETDRLVAGLVEAGWQLVDNQRVTIPTARGAVDVAGLGDPHIRRDRPDALAGPPAGSAALRLGVVHAPYRRALDALTAAGSELILAGHTHGGQVRIPGVGALVTNCDLPTRQARGLSRHGAAWLHVSAGLGTSMYAPVRFCCRPEASLLTVSQRTG